MLRLPNTLPNTEAGVHRHSRKHDMIFYDILKTLEKVQKQTCGGMLC